MEPTIIVDDITYKIKSLIRADFMCRIGEQKDIGHNICSVQFLFSPTAEEKKKIVARIHSTRTNKTPTRHSHGG
jgi:hypothetical protein